MQNKLRLEGLTLTVANVAKSVEFYGETLGLEMAYPKIDLAVQP